MLVINNDIVSQILAMGEVVEAQDAAFKKLPTRADESRSDLLLSRRRQSGPAFSAVGQIAYRKALEKRLGIEIPTDWFRQNIAINKPLIGELRTNVLTFATRRRIYPFEADRLPLS